VEVGEGAHNIFFTKVLSLLYGLFFSICEITQSFERLS